MPIVTPIPEDAIVLMYTGWRQKWSDYDAYKNQDADGCMHFPGFSKEAAKFLVEEREINRIDNLSVDAAAARGFSATAPSMGRASFTSRTWPTFTYCRRAVRVPP